jgi:class 3 adenylate cyclase
MPDLPDTSTPAFHYRWSWMFQAPPEQVWPLASDTHRFNEATGLPNTQVTETPDPDGGSRRTMQFRRFGIPVTWDEQPFEWIQPTSFGVLRVYHRGPVAWMQVQVSLTLQAGGGTQLTYEIMIQPANLSGYLAIPIQVGWISRRAFDRVFRQMDAALQEQVRHRAAFPLAITPLQPSAAARIRAIAQQLKEADHDPDLVGKLVQYIREAQDADLMRIRPFALADDWGADRYHLLALCLQAARFGLLDVSWDLLCPECRGAKSTAPTLANIERHVHCDSCNIDYEVDFDHHIELTFHPNPGIKPVERMVYCVGGPQNTPHIFVQQVLRPQSTKSFEVRLDAGRYRIRGPRIPGRFEQVMAGEEAGGTASTIVTVTPSPSDAQVHMLIDDDGIHPAEALLTTGMIEFVLENKTTIDQIVILEETTWSDQAATAAQVTTLQSFQDLFSSEVLRPMEQITVTNLTILFTDLKGSTAMYHEVGDAPAFGRVMDHFSVLRECVRAHHGSIIKTIGDAVMAAFVDPAAGVAAAVDMMQNVTASNTDEASPLCIKIGLHTGSCIAINQNDRLDYFGSTVNIAARIEGQSKGDEVVVSDAVMSDVGVKQFLADGALSVTACTADLKGFQASFQLYRITLRNPKETT